MLLDLLCTDNYISFNIKVANTMGLHAAIYINELMNISRKAEKKATFTPDGFMIVDRNYIMSRTTLSIEEQSTLDKKIQKVGVIELKEDNPDCLQVHIDILANIIASDEAALLQKVSKMTAVKKNSPGAGISARQRNIQALKNCIKCSNTELLEAYWDWVDGVYANPKGFLSKKSIEIFQRGLDDFTKGDLDLALKILEIATINGFRCVDWAIEKFQRDYAKDFYRQFIQPAMPVPDVKAPVRSTQLSDEVF